MSWSIYVEDIPAAVASPADIPDYFVPKLLGRRSDLISRIQEVVPSANFADPAWGKLDGPDFSIEIGIGEDELVQSFAFHVRGGDTAAYVVADILDRLSLRAFDPNSSSGIFDVDAASDGMRRWRAYRDTILR